MAVSVYVSDLTHTSQTIASNTMPSAVGGLVTYAKSRLKDLIIFEFTLFKYPEKLIAAVLDKTPDIACFSNYAWNLDLSYNVAARIKKRNPGLILIVGGPNYSTDAQEQQRFLEEHPLIDFCVFKEGEVAFAGLLQCLADNNFDVNTVKLVRPGGCHCLLDGKLVVGPSIERIKNLDDVPSPYLSGELDDFFDDKLVPIIQTSRGCPFSCTFCTEGLMYYNKISRRSTSLVYDEFCYIAQRKHPNIVDLHIADSNFGMYREDEDVAEAIAKVQKQYGWPEYLHTSTGKNQEERVLRVAKTVNKALRLAGSVQSLTNSVLANIKRKNISADQLMNLAIKARELGSNTYSEIILPLPGESRETHFKTIETVVNAKFNWVRLYTLMLLAGTEMSSRATRSQYAMTARYRVLPRCFGTYQFGSEAPVISAEIEEVCVATKDMSFEDYLECRLFHLTVEIFYNDSVASELVEFLNLFNISAFDWLLHIHNQRHLFPEALKQLYRQFYEETRDELWPSREDLESFVKREGVIEKYVSGECGKNLIFGYKALALRNVIKEVIGVAYNCSKALLKNRLPEVLAKYSSYLRELRQYSELKKLDLFNTASVFTAAFHYDFVALERLDFKSLPDGFDKPEGVEVSFFHTDEQKKIIEGALGVYGGDVVGISRILSKIHVSKIYRTLAEQNP